MRFALSGLSGGVAMEDLTNEHIWSPESYSLHGRDRKLGSPSFDEWLACLHPDDRAPIKFLVQDVLEKRAAELGLEYRVVFPTGEQRWISGLGKVDFAPDGLPVRISGINLDITEQKRAEEDMRRLNRTLQAYSASGWALARAGDEQAFCKNFAESSWKIAAMPWFGLGMRRTTRSCPLGPRLSPAMRTVISICCISPGRTRNWSRPRRHGHSNRPDGDF